MRKPKGARYYRRHPEQALREATNLGGEQKRQLIKALTEDPEALADLTAPTEKEEGA